MTEFVLVAGAWLGSSAWDEVVPELRAAGHGARPLTLSGLAERQGERAGQQTHVRDVVEEVERLDLRDVVLVGHSYSGIPVGQAAGRIGERLRHLVFVDSNVPVDGESFVAQWPEGRPMVEAAIAANGGTWPPLAEAYAGQGLDEARVARILADSTPHPGRTLTEPAELARPIEELPTTYVKCLLAGEELDVRVTQLVAGGDCRVVRMDTGHWPMFSSPRELARILLEAADPTPG
ncbi:alpha/beta fold hydrolase [Streptomyces alkaliterrae]|uniref:Alpha/beta fold hydrolase n=1 Tax=Streptomyces alkaliterrae TaxID=2213162 RepID=A0A5P0YU10_9ACTN|nr:alpha/beta hydrolase [Streptomyces alkaliterrae]MBB1255070.1 alpha/beta hydrolase [Streptomyces alkaliterrae]MBB1258257.1 alpha/beta hydrolase [Streptomyces alkaliterrae]MQS03400.1 alpha/beta fold hydrolase [Streptomyces alkaliterrae]